MEWTLLIDDHDFLFMRVSNRLEGASCNVAIYKQKKTFVNLSFLQYSILKEHVKTRQYLSPKEISSRFSNELYVSRKAFLGISGNIREHTRENGQHFVISIAEKKF